MMNFLEKTEIDGIKYYILEKNTPIYRGDSRYNINETWQFYKL